MQKLTGAQLVESLEWRYATKKFDKTKKIEEIVRSDSKENEIDDDNADNEADNGDPFRTTSTHRSKIFVK